MYKYSEIKTIHLELTSKCNTACPMCLRNICGGAVNPQLPLTELSLQDIKNIFPLQFLKQLNHIYMCGNYGDPMMAKETLEIFKYFRQVQPALKLSMFTNGSGRNSTWWEELAQTIDFVHFSIDGLENTNAIYRRGTNFKKIMQNARSYISAGGYAIWDYIVFRHNEHEVEQARALANTMGFQQFILKKTGRFFSNQTEEVKSEKVILNKKGEVEGYLKMPKNLKYQNRSLLMEKSLKNRYGSFSNYFNQTPIKCRVRHEKSLYISASALVFPCCWTANQLYPWYFKERSSQIWQLIKQLPEKENSLSAKKQPLKKIVEGEFFQKMIPNSWEGKDIHKDRLRVCAKTCGQEFKPFLDQFTK